jgi:3-oxoacyl-[acyl-carrier protein] reductase
LSEDKIFTGKSAIVTGGTRGIGKAIVLELARRGANVAFNYSKSAEEAQALKGEVESLGVQAFAEQCDVASTEAAAEFVGTVLRPMMRNENGGSILNISSISGVVGMLGQSNYSASKAGMIGLTKALAKEVASRKITVNALALGLVETEMAADMNAEYREKILTSIPLGRLGNVGEVAAIASFLLSPAAAYITGQVLQADGGLAM